MNKNPLNHGILTENSIGIGTVTREMVEARARELALIAGRIPPQVSVLDYEQAKRELTGDADVDPQEALLESIPDRKDSDPVPGSTGRQVADSSSEEEDEDGQSESAQLVEEGVREAEHDQMLKAAKAAEKDRSSR